jgi:hypothetical protein
MDSDMEEATVEGPDLEVLVALVGELGPKAPVIEGSSAINTDDAKLVYDCTHFRKYKATDDSRMTTGSAKWLWREDSW